MNIERDLGFKIELLGAYLEGILNTPEDYKGLIIFAHGSGSGRYSPRNQMVADVFNQAGFATLLFDLLTPEEEEIDDVTAEYRFNIQLISDRLLGTTRLMNEMKEFAKVGIGLFGASTGAAAALNVAGDLPVVVSAVVSRGGRPDLSSPENIKAVKSPTLFIVGEYDEQVLELNKEAIKMMAKGVKKELEIVPEATHLFGEPSKLEEVADIAKDWYLKYLK